MIHNLDFASILNLHPLLATYAMLLSCAVSRNALVLKQTSSPEKSNSYSTSKLQLVKH